jgi:dTMP kinase
MFIVLEGIDGCGKSTHAKLLATWLEMQGKKVYLTSEPTHGRIGQLIREILSGSLEVDPKTLALLFTADRAEHQEEIKSALDEGKVVVCERYYYSTVAYQNAQGVDWDWLLDLNKFAIQPDVVILLDIPLEEAERRYTGGEVFEKTSFLSKVRSNYSQFPELLIVDTSGSVDETQSKIREAL